MNPVAFDVEQTAFLPPHELVTYAKDEPEYLPLPVAKLIGPHGRVEDLYIEQLTFGDPLQPILPAIGLRDFCAMDEQGGR